MPDHSRITHSRNQEDTEGHERTRRRVNLSTGGHERKRRDTRGHDTRPVRDREAPGSNPGPPTSFLNSKVDPDDSARSRFRPWRTQGGHGAAESLPFGPPALEEKTRHTVSRKVSRA